MCVVGGLLSRLSQETKTSQDTSREEVSANGALSQRSIRLQLSLMPKGFTSRLRHEPGGQRLGRKSERLG